MTSLGLLKSLYLNTKENKSKILLIYFQKTLVNIKSSCIFALAITQDIATRKGD